MASSLKASLKWRKPCIRPTREFFDRLDSLLIEDDFHPWREMEILALGGEAIANDSNIEVPWGQRAEFIQSLAAVEMPYHIPDLRAISLWVTVWREPRAGLLYRVHLDSNIYAAWNWVAERDEFLRHRFELTAQLLQQALSAESASGDLDFGQAEFFYYSEQEARSRLASTPREDCECEGNGDEYENWIRWVELHGEHIELDSAVNAWFLTPTSAPRLLLRNCLVCGGRLRRSEVDDRFGRISYDETVASFKALKKATGRQHVLQALGRADFELEPVPVEIMAHMYDPNPPITDQLVYLDFSPEYALIVRIHEDGLVTFIDAGRPLPEDAHV